MVKGKRPWKFGEGAGEIEGAKESSMAFELGNFVDQNDKPVKIDLAESDHTTLRYSEWRYLYTCAIKVELISNPGNPSRKKR